MYNLSKAVTCNDNPVTAFILCSIKKYEYHLYIKIMPSDPQTKAFYEKFGFKEYDHYSAMVITR